MVSPGTPPGCLHPTTSCPKAPVQTARSPHGHSRPHPGHLTDTPAPPLSHLTDAVALPVSSRILPPPPFPSRTPHTRRPNALPGPPGAHPAVAEAQGPAGRPHHDGAAARRSRAQHDRPAPGPAEDPAGLPRSAPAHTTLRRAECACAQRHRGSMHRRPRTPPEAALLRACARCSPLPQLPTIAVLRIPPGVTPPKHRGNRAAVGLGNRNKRELQNLQFY